MKISGASSLGSGVFSGATGFGDGGVGVGGFGAAGSALGAGVDDGFGAGAGGGIEGADFSPLSGNGTVG